MEKGKFFSGLFIMTGLIFAGLMLPQAVAKYRSYDRVVYVKGLCEKEVKADKAIWPLVFKVSGNSLPLALAELESRSADVHRFLVGGGIDESEITENMTISDKATMEYNSDRSYRYIIKMVVTVCTQDVDKVLDLMARQKELLMNGISLESDWENQTEFLFEGLNEIKPEMIEEATRNAREVAVKFAEDSDSRLGKIKEATQGSFSISDRDSNTPSIKRVRVVTNVAYYLSK